MSDIQKRIKEALEKAEVGPWAKVEFFNGTMEIWQSIDNTYIARIIGNNETASHNAHLIANAPTWLLHQQELIEQKEKALREQFEINTKLVVWLEQKDTEVEYRKKYESFLKSCIACGETLEHSGYDKFEHWLEKYMSIAEPKGANTCAPSSI